MPNEKGETRRERNTAMGEYSPTFDIPDGGDDLWDIFYQLGNSILRIYDGICWPIEPVQIDAWARRSGYDLTPAEFDIILAMDVAFCSEMNKELQAYSERSRKPISGD